VGHRQGDQVQVDHAEQYDHRVDGDHSYDHPAHPPHPQAPTQTATGTAEDDDVVGVASPVLTQPIPAAIDTARRVLTAVLEAGP